MEIISSGESVSLDPDVARLADILQRKYKMSAVEMDTLVDSCFKWGVFFGLDRLQKRIAEGQQIA